MHDAEFYSSHSSFRHNDHAVSYLQWPYIHPPMPGKLLQRRTWSNTKTINNMNTLRTHVKFSFVVYLFASMGLIPLTEPALTQFTRWRWTEYTAAPKPTHHSPLLIPSNAALNQQPSPRQQVPYEIP